jgi:hypothetical protein
VSIFAVNDALALQEPNPCTRFSNSKPFAKFPQSDAMRTLLSLGGTMKRSLSILVVFALLLPTGLRAAAPQDSTKTTTKTTTKTVKKSKAARPTVSQQLDKMQEQLAAQSNMIQQQQAQLQALQQSNTQLQQRVQEQDEQLRSSLREVVQKANNTDHTATTLTSEVSDLKANTTTQLNLLSQTQASVQKSVKELESPLAIKYKGVTITPGGYLEAAFVVRTRNENSDQISNFPAIPFDGTANANLSEFRFTARGTRPTLLVEGKVGSKKLSGYWELDFLSAAPTANEVETSSFNPRQRQLWGQIEFENGTSATAGQMWSLLTTHRKGMATRSEFIPTTIEGSYIVGYTYVRQAAFRLVHNFHDKVWAGAEVANPETTFTTSNAALLPSDVFGLNSSPNAVTPTGALNPFLSGFSNGISTDLAPDVIGKLAFEPGFGHWEIKGLGRFFRTRTGSTTRVVPGGGIGFGMVLPVRAKKADFIVEGLWGRGIGRYGAANNADITLRPNGDVVPLRSGHVLAGLELHPNPKLDVYFYGGDEYYYRNPLTTVNPATGATVAFGYGSRLVVNTNCTVQVVPAGGAACGAQARNMWETSGGFWYRFFKGPYGTVQWGIQYEYLQKDTWAGVGGSPQASNHMVWNSFRFVLP